MSKRNSDESSNLFGSIIREYYPDSFMQRCFPRKKRSKTMSEPLSLERMSDVCKGILHGGASDAPAAQGKETFEELLAAEEYDGVISETDKLLAEIPPLITIAGAALARGKAILGKAMARIGATGEPCPPEAFESVWSAFELSSRLNPDCAETQEQIERLAGFAKEYERVLKTNAPETSDAPDYDVVVVGAGASGVGTAIMLTDTFGLEKSRVLLVERGEDVGETFRRWPKEMRFISPSFNQQGWTDSFDLNSISFGTSPAFSLHSEHPSGDEYARYLKAIATTNELNIKLKTEVKSIRPSKNEEDEVEEKKDDCSESEPPLFSVDVQRKVDEGDEEVAIETLTTHFVIWAAGEFQYKGEPDIPGADLCMHNSQVRSWADVEGDEFIVIGGYESGVDACVNLAKAGKKAKVLASTPCWDVKKADPSVELAPHTAARLREVMSESFGGPRPRLYAPLRVVEVEKSKEGYCITAEWQDNPENEDAPLREPTRVAYEDLQLPGTKLILKTANKPILATGFEGSVRSAASNLFAFADDDHPHKGCLGNAPLLTEDDESTVLPGLFLVGPQVQHDSLSFCFVYKFRQRFAVVANAICQGLGMDTRHAISECRNNNMYLDTFESCEDTCGDVC